jgi:uncharacterized protein YdeI (YjbR/CyaY-like superfamily)
VKPRYFATPAAFRAWLEEHGETENELWVGFHKKASGKPSITWPEAVDEALCFGWIDGVRRSVDADRYMQRFTPRKARSTWSAINLARAKELIRLRRMRPVGRRVYEARDDQRSGYSYEQLAAAARLDEATERQFRADAKAWAYFEAQPPWYRRAATAWVTNAVREETRRKRLATLIEDSHHARAIKPLRRPTKPASGEG